MAKTIADVQVERGLDKDSHPNDKFIYLQRSKSFLERVQPAGKVMFEESRQSIGSYYASKTSPIIGSGLNIAEQELLLPVVLNVSRDDRNFREAVHNFYREFFTPIPFGEGLRLNIGLLASNSKPVSVDNMPINLVDYLRYRHALKHPFVAADRDEAMANSRKLFYVYDPSDTDNKLSSQITNQDKAMSEYLAVKDDEDKVDMLLTMLGVDPAKIAVGKPAGIKISTKQSELRTIATTRPMAFLEAKDIDNFEERYIVLSLINAGIWSQIGGGTIIDSGTNAAIGFNIIEAVQWLKNPVNNNRAILYRTKLQDYLRKPLETKKAAAKKGKKQDDKEEQLTKEPQTTE